MDTLDVIIQVKRNGREVEGFPKSCRLTVDEIQEFAVERATGGGYISLPITEIATLQALILTLDQPATLRLDAQSDAGIELGAGGLVALIGITADASASTNATLSNASGSTALVSGLGAGT